MSTFSEYLKKEETIWFTKMKDAPKIIPSHPFLDGLYPHTEDIMTYCLGSDWRSYNMLESIIPIMESLGIHISPVENILDVRKRVKTKYEWLFCYHRYREVLTEKTYILFRKNGL